MHETTTSPERTSETLGAPWYIALGLFFFLVIPALVICHCMTVTG